MREKALILLALIASIFGYQSINAQGSIFGAVANADLSVPANDDIFFFGFINDQDNELRLNFSIGAGFDAGNWFDDFQNFQSEAPGLAYQYHFFNISNNNSARLISTIPDNSFQQENIDLAVTVWPTPADSLSAIGLTGVGLRLSWIEETGLTYHVYRRLSVSSGSFFRVDDPSGSLANSGVAGNLYLDETVDGVSDYDYLLISDDQVGNYSPPVAIFDVSSACAALLADADADSIADICDNCPNLANTDQLDSDGNGVGDLCQNCCVGIRGNANNDPNNEVNIADVTFLVKYLFGVPPGAPPVCNEESNANGDPEEMTNIADITFLTSYLFGMPSGNPPPPCP